MCCHCEHCNYMFVFSFFIIIFWITLRPVNMYCFHPTIPPTLLPSKNLKIAEFTESSLLIGKERGKGAGHKIVISGNFFETMVWKRWLSSLPFIQQLWLIVSLGLVNLKFISSGLGKKVPSRRRPAQVDFLAGQVTFKVYLPHGHGSRQVIL